MEKMVHGAWCREKMVHGAWYMEPMLHGAWCMEPMVHGSDAALLVMSMYMWQRSVMMQ